MLSLPHVTIGAGIVLIVLGLGGYLATQAASITALAPVLLGAVLVALGLLALKPDYRRHAMHGVAGLALLGLVGSLRGVIDLVAALGGAELGRPTAAAVQSLTALVCLILIVLAVRSFIQARRSRNTARGGDTA